MSPPFPLKCDVLLWVYSNSPAIVFDIFLLAIV